MRAFLALVFAVILQLSHECEMNPDSSSIVNGDYAKLGEFPHQLMLIVRNSSMKILCGAFLINKMQALTAAHCLDIVNYEYSLVKTGILTRETSEDQEVHVKSFVKHPAWLGKEKVIHSGDVAVLTFDRPIRFNKYVQPIEWNRDPELNYAGYYCQISGWGQDETHRSSHHLKKALIPLISHSSCFGLANYRNICVKKPGIGACMRDSGGPLTCCKNGKPLLVGISSYVGGKKIIINNREKIVCDADKPSIYAEVANYRDFIAKYIHDY